MEEAIAALNPPQREAVLHEGGPLLVLAGAGSGKTRVLTHRIAHLVRVRRVHPAQILAITFTNKAAGEMRERLVHLVGQGAARVLWASTFHSACVRILRREAERVGYRKDFSIFDQVDQLRVLRGCYEDLQLDPKRFAPRAMLGKISDAKNRLLTPDALEDEVSSFADANLTDLYRRYQDRLVAAGGMDFDDLLMKTVELLESDAEVRAHYQQRFEHVLVDEYQDTNHAQYRMVRVLSEPQRNVCVVGDDDQGIYSWRGAEVRNILDFERDYPDAHVVALEQNYRSTGIILRAANAVVARNPGRHQKKLWTDLGDGEPIAIVTCRDEHEEGFAVAGEIQRAIDGGTSLAEIAVFYRTNAQSRAIEDVLVRRAIPYQVIGGPKFYDRAEVKDALAYVRVAANPADTVALVRMLGTPKRGIGPGAVAKLDAFAREQGLAPGDALGLASMIKGITNAQGQAMADANSLLTDIRGMEAAGATVDRLLERALDGSGLRDSHKAEGTMDAQGRLENLDELVSVAQEYSARADEPSLAGFLQEIALFADADSLVSEGGRVTLMTIHNAKGLEFEVVMLAGLEEGIFPHQRSFDDPEALEEERRLCYVGLTRARRRLILTHAESRLMHGGRDYRLPSRFLAEIPEDAIAKAGGGAARRQGRPEPVARGLELATGDEVVHATFGEGTIVAVEQGGELVRVRFLSDGAERRLMAGYAPMKKVAS